MKKDIFDGPRNLKQLNVGYVFVLNMTANFVFNMLIRIYVNVWWYQISF